MYGNKIFNTGLFLVIASDLIIKVPAAIIVGAVFMLIGTILIWLDK